MGRKLYLFYLCFGLTSYIYTHLARSLPWSLAPPAVCSITMCAGGDFCVSLNLGVWETAQTSWLSQAWISTLCPLFSTLPVWMWDASGQCVSPSGASRRYPWDNLQNTFFLHLTHSFVEADAGDDSKSSHSFNMMNTYYLLNLTERLTHCLSSAGWDMALLRCHFSAVGCVGSRFAETGSLSLETLARLSGCADSTLDVRRFCSWLVAWWRLFIWNQLRSAGWGWRPGVNWLIFLMDSPHFFFVEPTAHGSTVKKT